MKPQHELEPFVSDWLHHTLDRIPAPTHRYGLVAQEVAETGQQRTWLAVPIPAQDTMWSTAKSIVAISIVALFGGLLLAGWLTAPPSEEAPPATVSERPAFPTGVFETEGGIRLELRPDGSCVRAGVACTYGVNGGLFSEMSSESSSEPQVPATYRWDYEDGQLTFELWGIDERSDRSDVYEEHVFTPISETIPLPSADFGFPSGSFVAVDDAGTKLTLVGDRWRFGSPRGGASGTYVVSEDLYTEMTHNQGQTAQVPATYRWRWDGEHLSFFPQGLDADAWRKSFYVDHVYVRAETPDGPLRRLLLSDPRLDLWVTVEIRQRDDGFVATATVDEEPLGEGTGDTQQAAVRAALEALGEPYASDMSANVEG